MKYAVIRTGGKQYRVTEGDVLEVDRLSHNNKNVTFDSILLYVNGDSVLVGTPNVSNVSVKASIIADTRGEKIRVSKYKAKVRYRRVTGFKSSLTKVKIDSIEEAGENKEVKEKTSKRTLKVRKKAV